MSKSTFGTWKQALNIIHKHALITPEDCMKQRKENGYSNMIPTYILSINGWDICMEKVEKS